MAINLRKLLFLSTLFIFIISCKEKDLDGGPIKGNSIRIIENGELVVKKDTLLSSEAAGMTVKKTFFVAGNNGRNIYYYVDKNDWCQITSESSWPYERVSFRLPIKDRDGNVIKEAVEGDLVTISFIIEQNKSRRKRECVFHLISNPSGTFQHESEVKIIQEGK